MSRVMASVDIPSGTKSKPFSLSKVSETINFDKLQFPLQVRIRNGEMELMESLKGKMKQSDWFWIKCLKLATDCHVQNVRICRWQSDAVILQATKDVRSGDELLLWFGEDVLVNDLDIPPYLNPQNIRGGKNYKCHKCGEEFEAPNPLKVHLALTCGSLPVDDLWLRLATPRNISPPSLDLRISSPSLNLRIAPPPLLFPTFTLSRAPPFYASDSEQSPSPAIQQRSLPGQLSQNGIKRSSSISAAAAFPLELVTAGQVKSLSDQQAHLETIMSNMGRGKNGHHVCVYCGKLYSRKYGLKIHIRTHTGFKPLQCKICHRPFGDPSNLNKHVRLHADGNTPYRCEICTKVLVRRRDLDRHIRSRHPTLEPPTQQSAIDCSIRQNNSIHTISNEPLRTETRLQSATVLIDN